MGGYPIIADISQSSSPTILLAHIRARLFKAIGFDNFLQPLPTQSHVKTAAGISPWTSAAAAQRWFRHREESI